MQQKHTRQDEQSNVDICLPYISGVLCRCDNYGLLPWRCLQALRGNLGANSVRACVERKVLPVDCLQEGCRTSC